VATDNEAIERVGGRLCLDFVNTRASHFLDDAREYLHDYTDLVRWMRGCDGGLDAQQTTRLNARARAHPRSAATAFAGALELRDLLYRVLSAVAEGSSPARVDIETLNRETTNALAQRRLSEVPIWRWTWPEDDAFELPMWLALESAAGLLVDDDLMRLKECPAPDGCGWLFYDVSKNGSRRWCSMRMCGNAAKARAFQRRLRNDAR